MATWALDCTERVFHASYDKMLGMTTIISAIWTVLRSIFWTKQWISWANKKFPDPPQGTDTTFSRISGFILISLFIIAYAFYGDLQIVGLSSLISSILHSLSLRSLANNAIVILIICVFYTYSLRASLRKLIQSVAYILHPILLIYAYLALYHLFQDWPPAKPWANYFLPLIMIAYIICFGAAAYMFYRAVKSRLNAAKMHSALGSVIELALSARALSLVLHGKATILNIPFIPGRLLMLTLPIAAVIFYTFRAIQAQRAHMARQHTSFTAELQTLLGHLRHQPYRLRLAVLWAFRRTQTYGFTISLLLIAGTTLWLPVTIMDAHIY